MVIDSKVGHRNVTNKVVERVVSEVLLRDCDHTCQFIWGTGVGVSWLEALARWTGMLRSPTEVSPLGRSIAADLQMISHNKLSLIQWEVCPSQRL